MEIELSLHQNTPQYLSHLTELETVQQVRIDVPPHLRETYLRLLVLSTLHKRQKYKIHATVQQGSLTLRRTYFNLQSLLTDETILMNSILYFLILFICVLLGIMLSWKHLDHFRSASAAAKIYETNYSTALKQCAGSTLTMSTLPNYYIHPSNVSIKNLYNDGVYYFLFNKLSTSNNAKLLKKGDVDLTDSSISSIKAITLKGQNPSGNIKFLLVLCFSTTNATLEKGNETYSGKVKATDLSLLYSVKNDISPKTLTLNSLKTKNTFTNLFNVKDMPYIEIRLHT